MLLGPVWPQAMNTENAVMQFGHYVKTAAQPSVGRRGLGLNAIRTLIWHYHSTRLTQ